jgi:hypothetical protein
MNTFWYPKTSFHDPDYVPTIFQFETTADLLDLANVRRCGSLDAEFVMSGEHLMVLYKDGFEWWVVGKVGKPEEVDLPKWEGPKIRVVRQDGTEFVTTNVQSICGDQITLRDGQVVTRIKRD